MGTNKNFAENLVKGKIAETLFAQMFRETGNFTVIEFGYEKILPEILGRGIREKDDAVETLRTAPDFAVIHHTTRQVRLVEVKYRAQPKDLEIKAAAERMHKSWNPSYLFLATSSGFYFDEISMIINRDGRMSPLSHSFISVKVQDRYLNLLHEFEPDTFIQKSAKKSAKILS
jgi:hypothetical protein